MYLDFWQLAVVIAIAAGLGYQFKKYRDGEIPWL